MPRFADSVSIMSRIAALLIVLALTACGIKGPLQMPPNAGKPVPTVGSDVSTSDQSPDE